MTGPDRDEFPLQTVHRTRKAGVRAVGFDLDMTLVDSRAVSRRALERLASGHGPALDVDVLMENYGTPLSQWLPSGADGSRFRTLQLEEVALTVAMPGAMAAVEAVRGIGCRVVVVTAAPALIAEQMLRAVGLSADSVWADVWATGKEFPLRTEGCEAFVGDHADDMSAARSVGAVAIGVSTGTSPPTGADITLDDLTSFPAWITARTW